MRLSDADREQFVDALGRHVAEGRLALEEFERRLAIVLQAQSRQEALATLADLPPLPHEPPSGRARRGHGHGDADAPAADWIPTRERFRDPRSARVMRVWVDTAGARHYVAEDEDSS